MNRPNKFLFTLNFLVLAAVALLGAAGGDGNLQVDSITVGSGENKVLIAANKSLTGLAVHKGHDTVALLGVDGTGEPNLRLAGRASVQSVAVDRPGAVASVAIEALKFASGVWVTEKKAEGYRHVAMTVAKPQGPALEMMSGGTTNPAGDDFAVSFDLKDGTPVVQFAGRDRKLHFLDVDQFPAGDQDKAKKTVPKPG